MNTWQRLMIGVGVLSLLVPATESWGFQDKPSREVAGWLNTLQKLDALDSGVEGAKEAAKKLQSQDGSQLLNVLLAFDGATPIGRNWLTGVATRLYVKADAATRKRLETFLAETQHQAEARYLVFQWLTENSVDDRKARLRGLLEDPSPEIRFAAVALAMEENEGKKSESATYVARLMEILESGRHHEQVTELCKRLKEAGKEIDQAYHFGFLRKWTVLGPFDNREQKGFDVVYPPESDLIQGRFKADGKYEGKHGSVTWKDAEGNAVEGAVDLNPLYNNEKNEQEKGALVYARTIFQSGEERPAELRLGCMTASKVWFNGELVMSHNVYHAGMQIDQYISPVRLKKGANEIVLKVCQNEQTESWAQLWTYQLRVCDETGKAIHEAESR